MTARIVLYALLLCLYTRSVEPVKLHLQHQLAAMLTGRATMGDTQIGSESLNVPPTSTVSSAAPPDAFVSPPPGSSAMLLLFCLTFLQRNQCLQHCLIL